MANTSLFQHWAVALDWIFRAEGHLSNDPDDPGGTTKYGISLRALKQMDLAIGDIDGDGNIDADDILSLELKDAGNIYRHKYWTPCKCDDLPIELAVIVFDCSVNSGPSTAIRLLQDVLQVNVDGVVGPITINAARTRDVVREYLGRRAVFYHDITLANSSLAKFLQGWFNRLFRLQHYLCNRRG